MKQNKLIESFGQMNKNNNIAQTIMNSNFQNQMAINKMEQIQRVNKVSDLGLSKEQIVDYIICPIKVEKSTRDEFERTYNNEVKDYSTKVDDWWKTRTNIPYKNILKYEQNKVYNTQQDLVVYRSTNDDKLGLIDEYDKLLDIIKKHNDELQSIYSISKEIEHKKNFEYVNKSKYKMPYDPKNYGDLKEYYNTEQKKMERDQKRLEEIISKLTNDDINDDDIKKIEMEFTDSQPEQHEPKICELTKKITKIKIKSSKQQYEPKQKTTIHVKKIDK